MPASTSGLTSFNLDVDDIIEQALEPLGTWHSSMADRRFPRLRAVLLHRVNRPVSFQFWSDIPVPIFLREHGNRHVQSSSLI